MEQERRSGNALRQRKRDEGGGGQNKEVEEGETT